MQQKVYVKVKTKKVWRTFLDAGVQLLHERGAVCWCTVLLQESSYQTLRIAGVIMTSSSSIEEVCKTYHQNFLLRNNNEITHALQIYLTFFVKKCMRLHFSR